MYLEPIGAYMDDEKAHDLLITSVLSLKPENIETVKGITVSELITAAYILTDEGKAYVSMFETGKAN
ncbi:MAG: hypothetical protein IKG00_00055 [Lachnospiraceae bacterium]|nr:hypothetical protein [Lachnospiraceae bacterium]